MIDTEQREREKELKKDRKRKKTMRRSSHTANSNKTLHLNGDKT